MLKACRVTRLVEKNLPNSLKSSQNSCQAKINLKVWKFKTFQSNNFLNPNLPQQTMFWNCLFRWKCINIACKKWPKNVAISLGYLTFLENHNELLKSSPIDKNPPNLVLLLACSLSFESGFVINIIHRCQQRPLHNCKARDNVGEYWRKLLST